jgi:hypothetical protein
MASPQHGGTSPDARRAAWAGQGGGAMRERGCGRRGGRRGGGMRVKRDQRGQQSAVSRRRGGGYRPCPLTSSPLARAGDPRKAFTTLPPSAARGRGLFRARPTRRRDRSAPWRLPSYSLFAEPAARRHSATRTARGWAGHGGGASGVCGDNYRLGRASLPATISLSPCARRAADLARPRGIDRR